MGTNEHIIKAKTKGFKKAKKDIKGVNKSLVGMAKAALTAGAALYGAKKLLDGMKAVVNLAARQELAMKKLETVLKSTRNAVGMTSRELAGMASSLQKVTRFGDEAIIEAQSLMLTFTKIGREVMPDAMETVLNMSEAMGTSLKDQVIQLGKALNDPIMGISALSRVGVQLSDDQKELINSFMEVNDVASAQQVILGELETQFGGMAKEGAKTFTGQIDQMHNALGDMGEEIGKHIIPMITTLANKIKSFAEFVGMYVSEPLSETLKGDRIEFKLYTDMLLDTIRAEEDRSVIIGVLNERFSEHIGDLDLEKARLEDVLELQEDVNEAYMDRIIMAAGEERLKKAVKEQQDAVHNLSMEIKNQAKAVADSNREKTFSEKLALAAMVAGGFYQLQNANANAKLSKDGIVAAKIKLQQAKENLEQLHSEDEVVKLIFTKEKERIKQGLKQAETARIKALEATTAEGIKQKELNDLWSEWTDEINKTEREIDEFTDKVLEQREAVKKYLEETAPELTLQEQLQAYMDFYTSRNELVEISESEHAQIVAYYNKLIAESEEETAKTRKDAIISTTQAALQAAHDLVAISGSHKQSAKNIAIAETVMSTYYAAQEAYTNWIETKLPIDPATKQALGYANAAIAVAQGMARVQQIKKAQAGADYIADEPQMLMVGEGGLRERVQVTPLDGVNVEGGGQGITLNISGNVLTDSFVEENVVPSLREALRQGESLA